MAGILEKPGKTSPGLAQAVELMKVLSHPVRLSILCKLIHQGEMTAGELVEAERKNASQSQVSQYLGMLRDMGYVRARREGQVMHYAVSNETVRKIVEGLYGAYCDSRKK